MCPPNHIYARRGDGRRQLVNLEERLNRISRWCAAAAIVVGLTVACGWAFDMPALRTLLPGFPEMKFNAALAFVLSGTSLWLLKDSRNRFGTIAALIVTAMGLATCAE